MQRRAVHVVIHGRVQGVGYRAWTEARAEEAGLDGWVRNRAEGTVEAIFAGPPEAVERMLELCRSGPRGAIVSRVEIMGEGGFAERGFHVRPTA